MEEIIQKIKNLFQNKKTDNKNQASLNNNQNIDPVKLVENFKLPQILPQNKSLREAVFNVKEKEQVKKVVLPEIKKTGIGESLSKTVQSTQELSQNIAKPVKELSQTKEVVDIALNLPSKTIGAILTPKKTLENLKTAKTFTELYEKTPTVSEVVSEKLEKDVGVPKVLSTIGGLVPEFFIPTLPGAFIGAGKFLKKGADLGKFIKEIKELTDENKIFNILKENMPDLKKVSDEKLKDLSQKLSKIKTERGVINEIDNFLKKEVDKEILEKAFKAETKKPKLDDIKTTQQISKQLEKELENIKLPDVTDIKKVEGENLLNLKKIPSEQIIKGTEKVFDVVPKKEERVLNVAKNIFKKENKEITEAKDELTDIFIKKDKKIDKDLQKIKKFVDDYSEHLKTNLPETALKKAIKGSGYIPTQKETEFLLRFKPETLIDTKENVVGVLKTFRDVYNKNTLEKILADENDLRDFIIKFEDFFKKDFQINKDLIDDPKTLKGIKSLGYNLDKQDLYFLNVFDKETLLKNREKIYDIYSKISDKEPYDFKKFLKADKDILLKQDPDEIEKILIKTKSPAGLERLKKEISDSDYLMSSRYLIKPKYVFSNLGDAIYNNVYLPVIKATRKYIENVSNDIKAFQDLLKKYGFIISKYKSVNILFLKTKKLKESSIKVFDYLDGAISKEQLTENELKIAEYIRGELDNYLKKINEVRASLMLDKVGYRENYITHIVNKTYETFEELVKKTAGEEALKKNIDIPLLKELIPGIETKNPTLLKRYGSEFPIVRDAFKAFRGYIILANKTIAYQKPIEIAKKYINALPIDANRYIREFLRVELGYEGFKADKIVSEVNLKIRKFLADIDKKLETNIFTKKEESLIVNKLGRRLVKIDVERALIDRLFPIQNPVSKLINHLRFLNYVSFLGFNLKVAFMNLIAQPYILLPASLPKKSLSTFLKVPFYQLKAFVEFFLPAARKKYSDLRVFYEVRNYVTDEIFEDRITQDFFLFFMSLTEFMNRTLTFNLSKKAFIKIAKEEAQKTSSLIPDLTKIDFNDLAREFSELINYRYVKSEQPLLLSKNPLTRSYLQYATFAFETMTKFIIDSKKVFQKELYKDFIKSLGEGKGADFLHRYGAPTRIALFKTLFYTTIVMGTLSTLIGINPVKLVKSKITDEELNDEEKRREDFLSDVLLGAVVPNLFKNTLNAMFNFMEGDFYQGAHYFGRAMMPAIVSGLLKSNAYELLLEDFYNEGFITSEQKDILAKIYIPKNIVPAEIQIEKFLRGETPAQYIGIEKLPRKDEKIKLPKRGKKDTEKSIDISEIENIKFPEIDDLNTMKNDISDIDFNNIVFPE
ncbi:MAG: hypothetical protein N2Z85_00370 [Patescibacteria group bacterium]|nr:hypothetical protein [Patescibacteria group bacterium]